MSNDIYYENVAVASWDALIHHIKKPEWNGWDWAFRGQEDSAWPLTTSLERAVGEARLSEAPGLEFRIIRDFIRGAHQYLRDVPPCSNVFEWMALMQHYGAPTRVMDWTYSPYVALHFAINPALSECQRDKPKSAALWVVDLKWVRDCVCNQFPGELGKTWMDPDARGDPCVLAQVFAKDDMHPMVLGHTPFRRDERLVIQQGTFLVPRCVTKPFEKNLQNMEPTNKHVVKIELQLDHWFLEDAHRELRKMNISEATLFPGLDGFARSLKSMRHYDFSVFPPHRNVFAWALDRANGEGGDIGVNSR